MGAKAIKLGSWDKHPGTELLHVLMNRFVKRKSVHLLPKSNQGQEMLELQAVITTQCNKSRIEFHYFEVTHTKKRYSRLG